MVLTFVWKNTPMLSVISTKLQNLFARLSKTKVTDRQMPRKVNLERYKIDFMPNPA